MIGPKEPEATDSAENEVLQSKIFDHLGLVAGMFEELEIGDRIDEQIAQDFEERNVSIGQAVKALILTGLGFVQQRLYLTAQFFEKMPTDRLIGEEVRPEHLNDDVLGRALDDLYDYGVTELFRDLAAHAVEKLGLSSRFAHLDATSFSFEGDYDPETGPAESSEDGVIRIQQGYSRDNRPDLNQVVLDMIVERKAGLPVLMEPLSGNVNDSGSFPELIERHVDHLQNVHGFDYVVADSSLYSADHVEELTESGVKFVTRVPETISEAKMLILETEVESMDSLTEGYRGEEHRSEYGGIEQRWLLVYSEEAEEQARESARDQVQKEHEEKSMRRKQKPSLSSKTGSSRVEKTLSRRSKTSRQISRRVSLPKNRSSERPATRWKSPPHPVGKATGSKRPER